MPSDFVVRQFFMRHPGEEAAVLAAVADLLRDKRLIVTFNGRGFDVPLLRVRYLQNRRQLAERASGCAAERERTTPGPVDAGAQAVAAAAAELPA